MKLVESVSITTDLVVDVVCNMCGGTCSAGTKKDDPSRFVSKRQNARYVFEEGDVHHINQTKQKSASYFNGLIEQTVSGVYGSDSLEDMTHYTFSMCEHCLKDLFERFKHPVEVAGYDFG